MREQIITCFKQSKMLSTAKLGLCPHTLQTLHRAYHPDPPMHWHAIRKPAITDHSNSLGAYDGSSEKNETIMKTRSDIPSAIERECFVPTGHDDASDAMPALERTSIINTVERAESATDDEDNEYTDEYDFLPTAMPTASDGLTTIAYQKALANRIDDSKLARHELYDVRTYTPTFIHDCLMLPGSLASLLGKVNETTGLAVTYSGC